MESFTVSFFGHRRIENVISLDRKLDQLIREFLESKTYVELLVGRNGEFDQMVSSAVRRAKREYRADNSSLVLVLLYITAEYKNNEEAFRDYYDEIEVCEASASAHYKSAISIRNFSMVDRSDLVVCCIEHNRGGAYETVKYAQRRQKQIYNLYSADIKQGV